MRRLCREVTVTALRRELWPFHVADSSIPYVFRRPSLPPHRLAWLCLGCCSELEAWSERCPACGGGGLLVYAVRR